MIIALSILAVFAIAAAIGAGSRAQQQMALSQSRSTLEKPDDAAEPRLEPLDTNQADSSALPSDSPDKRLDFRLKGQVSLAGSLSVSEAMHPTHVEPAIAGITPNRPAHAHNHSLLAEVAELAPNGHKTQISHLARSADSSDPVTRTAVAFALGDLATHCHGEDSEKILSILHKLSQDANSQVRLQAATALGTLQPSNLFSE